jgi:hypothetical protein
MTIKQLQKAKSKLAKQEKEKKYKRIADYLTVVSVAPVICDLIEDLYMTELSKPVKDTLNNAITELIKLDEVFLTGADKEVIEQQNNIKLAFRQWQKDVFLNELM